MPSPDQSPALDWRDNVIPVSRQFDDPYFSLAGGLEETRHVFLAGNRLPEGFVMAFTLQNWASGQG